MRHRRYLNKMPPYKCTWGRKITRDALESGFIYRETCYE